MTVRGIDGAAAFRMLQVGERYMCDHGTAVHHTPDI